MKTEQPNIIHLITARRFIEEVGMCPKEFYRYAKDGRIDGLIIIDDYYFVDRSQVNIHFHRNGYKFGLWKELGGRHTAVSVPEFIKTRNRQAKGVSPEKLANG